jgi:hypothetical protein
VSVLEVAAAAAREDANAGPLAERVHVVYGVVQGPGPAGVPRVRHPLVQRRRRVGGHQDVELRPSVIADVAPAGVAPGRRGLHAAVHSGERAADRGAARAAGDSQRRVPGGQRGALLLGRHAAPGAGAHGVVRGRDLAVEEAGVLGRAQRLPGLLLPLQRARVVPRLLRQRVRQDARRCAPAPRRLRGGEGHPGPRAPLARCCRGLRPDDSRWLEVVAEGDAGCWNEPRATTGTGTARGYDGRGGIASGGERVSRCQARGRFHRGEAGDRALWSRHARAQGWLREYGGGGTWMVYTIDLIVSRDYTDKS